MSDFETKHLPMARNTVAPDGSDVRILLGLKGGGMGPLRTWTEPGIDGRYPSYD
jgi:hypothetical protein